MPALSLIGSKCPVISSRIVRPLTLLPVRNAAGKWRSDNNLPPRYAQSTILTESPEWSFIDGRGYGPLNRKQKARYFRDAIWTQEVIKITGQMAQAKKLVPDDVEKAELKFREKFKGFDPMP